ncbi:MAG TPA: flavohemoglobin expression-modulating QEGLA motif protein [Polyangia bacterium]
MPIPAALETLVREVSAEILEAQKPIRVLRLLSWPVEVETDFFARGAKELPRPTYRVGPELPEALERLKALSAKLTGENAIERFLRDTVGSLATAGRMLLAVGSKDFYYHSVELYGRPGSLSSDRATTNLGLARHFAEVVSGFAPVLGDADRVVITAEEAVPLLKARFETFFPGREIRVILTEGMAAAASANADGVKINRGAMFSQRDLQQIEFHEGQVHTATTINGRAQPVLVFLGVPSPRTTSTQEGMAVFTEFLTRSTSLPRVRRLSDRVLAIQAAEEGADFIQIFRFFVERGYDESAAFDCARRVFRGGLLEGGAPFTKDVCYLDGLLRVTNFLRIALTQGKGRMVRALFAGKLSVEDMPLIDRLIEERLAIEPLHTPAWANDLSYLTALMSYAAFLGESDLSAEKRRFDDACDLVHDLA